MLVVEKAALEIDATMWKQKKSEVESLAQLFDAAKKKLDAEELSKAEELTNTKVELQLALLQVGHLQRELEREKKRSRDEKQNSEHRIKELQIQVEKLKLGRVLTQQAVDEEKCLVSEVTSREEVQKRKCVEPNVGSVKKVRFAVEDDSHVQELGAAPPSEYLLRPHPNKVVVECPTGNGSPIKENIPQENMKEGNFVQHISTEVTNLNDSDDNILVIDLPDVGGEVIAEVEGSNAGAVPNKTTKGFEAAGGGRVNVMKRLVSMSRDEASSSGEVTIKFDQGSRKGREVEEGDDMKMTTWKLSKRCKQWAEERKQMDRCRVFCPMQNCKVTVNLAKIRRHLHRVHATQKWWLPLRCPDCEESVESMSLHSHIQNHRICNMACKRASVKLSKTLHSAPALSVPGHNSLISVHPPALSHRPAFDPSAPKLPRLAPKSPRNIWVRKDIFKKRGLWPQGKLSS